VMVLLLYRHDVSIHSIGRLLQLQLQLHLMLLSVLWRDRTRRGWILQAYKSYSISQYLCALFPALHLVTAYVFPVVVFWVPT